MLAILKAGHEKHVELKLEIVSVVVTIIMYDYTCISRVKNPQDVCSYCFLHTKYKTGCNTGCNCIVHGGEPYKHPKHSHTVHDKRHARLLNLHKSIVVEAKTVRGSHVPGGLCPAL